VPAHRRRSAGRPGRPVGGPAGPLAPWPCPLLGRSLVRRPLETCRTLSHAKKWRSGASSFRGDFPSMHKSTAPPRVAPKSPKSDAGRWVWSGWRPLGGRLRPSHESVGAAIVARFAWCPKTNRRWISPFGRSCAEPDLRELIRASGCRKTVSLRGRRHSAAWRSQPPEKPQTARGVGGVVGAR
jgi:hypothetical protein